MPPPGGGAIMRITMSIEMISIRLCELSRSSGDEMKPNETKRCVSRYSLGAAGAVAPELLPSALRAYVGGVTDSTLPLIMEPLEMREL